METSKVSLYKFGFCNRPCSTCFLDFCLQRFSCSFLHCTVVEKMVHSLRGFHTWAGRICCDPILCRCALFLPCPVTICVNSGVIWPFILSLSLTDGKNFLHVAPLAALSLSFCHLVVPSFISAITEYLGFFVYSRVPLVPLSPVCLPFHCRNFRRGF